MCKFKSGIILKNRVEFGDGITDSHEDILKSLGIKDDYLGATKTFIRAELRPAGDRWWLDPAENPGNWRFVVDQDVTPDWFDRDEHEKVFREAVCGWWKDHVLVDQKLDRLSNGYYRLRHCKVRDLCKNVKVLLYDTKVGAMWDNSLIVEMRGSSRVREMWDMSEVVEMWDESEVSNMGNSSQIGTMQNKSQVGVMMGTSRIGMMRGSSRIGTMYDSSRVGPMRESSQIGMMRDMSWVGTMYDSSRVETMGNVSQIGTMRGSSRIGIMWNLSRICRMYESSWVGEMWDASQVGEMWESSQIGEMRGTSIARDFKSYPDVKIWVPEESKITLDKR